MNSTSNNSSDIRNLRLINQRLVNPSFKTPVEVVSWFGAIQSQDFYPSLWSVSQRLDHNVTVSEVEKYVNRNEIIRTWPMRGTIHLILPENIKWMLKLLAPRIIRKMQSYYKKSELTESVFKKGRQLVEKELMGGKTLTRPELYKIFEEQKINVKDTRGLFILGNLAMNGVICFGPKKGKQPTFVLVDEIVKTPKRFDVDEAITEMARMYFRTHGPAQIEDFMWWTGLNKGEALIGIENLKNELVKEVVNEKEYYMFPSKSSETKNKRVFILSAYDEYTVAFKDRSDIFKASNLNPIAAMNGYWNSMVLDGVVIGMFRRVFKKENINFSFSPIVKLSSLEKEIFEKESDRYAKFFESKAEISWK